MAPPAAVAEVETAPTVHLPLGTLAALATRLVPTAEAWQARLVADSRRRSAIRLLATNELEAWLLRWPADSRVTPHDHGDSAGAFVVVWGELREIRWERHRRHEHVVGPGTSATVERGTVHDVVGSAPDSLSVHVYSPPLSSMSYYDLDGHTVVYRAPVDEEPPLLDATRVLHPARQPLA